VIRSVYGDSFPVSYVYDRDQILAEISSTRLFAVVAYDQDKNPVGYASLFRTAPNPRLWEGGNLVVVTALSGSGLAWDLMEYLMRSGILPGDPPDGFFGESVCHHYFTQVGSSKFGFHDCAILLDQVAGDSFREHRPDTERVACVLQYLEQKDFGDPVFLPYPYKDRLMQLAGPLRPRQFRESSLPIPAHAKTVWEDQYFESSGTWKISVSDAGSDWEVFLDERISEARARQVVSLQVILSAGMPCISAAVAQMRTRGFFLAGLFPRWFGTDGIILQQVFGKEPDYKGIKLYTPTARALLEFIRSDRESVMSDHKE
jgi:hypothetical protein